MVSGRRVPPDIHTCRATRTASSARHAGFFMRQLTLQAKSFDAPNQIAGELEREPVVASGSLEAAGGEGGVAVAQSAAGVEAKGFPRLTVALPADSRSLARGHARMMTVGRDGHVLRRAC